MAQSFTRNQPLDNDVTLASDSQYIAPTVHAVKGYAAPLIRAINTTSPLYGGGDLSADRTLYTANKVKNTSGATANAGEVGYVTWTSGSGMEYKTTTILNDNRIGSIAVVIVGGANNADIYVTDSGRHTIPYAGGAPNAGDFMVFSTTAGKLAAQAVMYPDVCAIAMAAGSGGNVDVLMLARTTFVPYTSTNDLYRCNSHSQSLFVATINGAPSATSVVYNAPSSGQEDVLPPNASTELAKLMLYNSTRSTGRLITACNTGTNTITTVSSTDAWAAGDTLTIVDPTINYTGTPKIAGFDLSQQSEIPVLARAIWVNQLSSDSGAAGQISQYHPYEAYSGSKLINVTSTNNSAAQIFGTFPISLINRRFGKFETASGTGTKLTLAKIVGYELATP